jgi:outer membrane protein assembly factor BamB
MSDYITGLRADLVDAAARHQRRGALARKTIAVRPRAWSRPALAAALATAACLAVVLVAVRAIGPPAPQPTRPHVLKTTKVAGVVYDAVLAGGALWVTDFSGSLVRVDPTTGQVLGKTPLGGSPRTIASGQGSVWAIVDGRQAELMVQVDPRSGRVIDRHAVAPNSFDVFTVDGGGMWVMAEAASVAMERVPAPGRAPIAELRVGLDYTVGAVGAPSTLWVVTNRGTLVEADNLTGRVIHSLPSAVTGDHGNRGDEFPENGLAVDADGVWAVDQDREVVVRFSGGRVVQRIRAGGYPGPIAFTRNALWVSVTDPLKRRYRIVRFDPSSGRATGSVNVGYHVPKALVPSPHGLWVVASDGTALLVR